MDGTDWTVNRTERGGVQSNDEGKRGETPSPARERRNVTSPKDG